MEFHTLMRYPRQRAHGVEIGFDTRPHVFDGLACVNDVEPFRLTFSQVEERDACATLEVVAGRLHAVFGMLQPRMRLRRIHIQQIRAFRQQTVRGPHAQVSDFRGRQLAAARLVRQRGIEIPVGDDHRAALQSGQNHFRDVLRAVGGEQQRSVRGAMSAQSFSSPVSTPCNSILRIATPNAVPPGSRVTTHSRP